MLNISQAPSDDIQNFGAMVEGVERVSSVLVQCAFIEQLFMSNTFMWRSQLSDLLTGLYASVLDFCSKGKSFSRRITTGEIIRDRSGPCETNVTQIVCWRASLTLLTWLYSYT